MVEIELQSICCKDSLLFRAACNQSVAADLRPIKPLVIARLARRDEACNVLKEVWRAISVQDEQERIPTFFKNLAEDVRWQTLVVEEAAKEKHWKDLFVGDFGTKVVDKIIDRALAFAEKLVQAHSEVVHVTSLCLAIVVAYKYLQTHPLNIPVEITPSVKGSAQVHVGMMVDNPSLPVTLLPRVDNSQPAKIKAVIESGDGGNIPASKSVCSSTPDQGCIETALQLQNIAQEIARWDPAATARAINEASANLATIAGSLNNLKDKMDQHAQAVGQQIHGLDNTMEKIYKIGGDKQGAISMLLLNGLAQSSAVTMFDSATENTAVVPIKVKALNIKNKNKINQASLVVTVKGVPYTLPAAKEGDTMDLPVVHCKLLVNEIQTQALHRHFVRITISPERQTIETAKLQ